MFCFWWRLRCDAAGEDRLRLSRVLRCASADGDRVEGGGWMVGSIVTAWCLVGSKGFCTAVRGIMRAVWSRSGGFADARSLILTSVSQSLLCCRLLAIASPWLTAWEGAPWRDASETGSEEG